RQPVMTSELPHLGLGHVAQGKARAAELLLGKTEEEISLVLGQVGGATQEPAIALGIEFAAGVVPGGQQIGADLARRDQQLIEFEMVVAQAARNRRATGEILLHERPHHIALEPLLVIDHIVRNAQFLGYAAGIVDIVNRAAASLYMLRHAFTSSQAAL